MNCPENKDNESNDGQELVAQQGDAVDLGGLNARATIGSANRPAAGII
jgi:hypothetical protein